MFYTFKNEDYVHIKDIVYNAKNFITEETSAVSDAKFYLPAQIQWIQVCNPFIVEKVITNLHEIFYIISTYDILKF